MQSQKQTNIPQEKSAAVQQPISPREWQQQGCIYNHRGHDIFYRREGVGPPLLLVHGFPTASWDFAWVWSELIKSFDVIAPDMIGFGFSAKPRPYRYSVFDQVELMEGLLNHLEIDAVDVFAHDFGDTIIQEMLVRRRERKNYPQIKSASLMNGGLFYDLIRPIFMQRLLRSSLGRLAQHLMNRRGFYRSFSSVFGPNTQPDEQELEAFWRLITHNRGTGVMHSIIQYLGERERFQTRWTKALAETSVPLQFIYGPEDPVSGTLMAERLAKINADVDIRCLDGIGHYPQVEAPDRVLSAFWAFHARLNAEK